MAEKGRAIGSKGEGQYAAAWVRPTGSPKTSSARGVIGCGLSHTCEKARPPHTQKERRAFRECPLKLVFRPFAARADAGSMYAIRELCSSAPHRDHQFIGVGD